jgi:hypothetical protein
MMRRMVEVLVTDEFLAWFTELDEALARLVDERVTLVEQLGMEAGFPYSSVLAGAKYPLRELRAKASGTKVRIACAFEVGRGAILLLRGAKQGDDQFDDGFVAQAEGIWEQYLTEQGVSR